MISNAGTYHNLFITDAARKTASTGQDHAIDLNATEAPVSTGRHKSHSVSPTAVAHVTDPPADLLADTPTRTPCTITTEVHP